MYSVHAEPFIKLAFFIFIFFSYYHYCNFNLNPCKVLFKVLFFCPAKYDISYLFISDQKKTLFKELIQLFIIFKNTPIYVINTSVQKIHFLTQKFFISYFLTKCKLQDFALILHSICVWQIFL